MMKLLRLLTVLAAMVMLAVPAMAQETADPRAATGGAQTLADILARQAGQKVDDTFRRDAIGNPEGGAPLTDQLGTLGGVSDPELWRALRYNEADLTVTTRTAGSKMIIQDSGMAWLAFRQGPLLHYGGYLLLGVIAVLLLFYLIRGKIRIEGPHDGTTITRFNALERFGHWLMAGSFIVLALTGLFSLFGRLALIPLIGKDAYAPAAAVGKWLHNNIAWSFMLGLAIVIVVWVAHNIPNRYDLKWIAVGGGLFSKGVHPPAKKFNAGQKVIFWLVVLFGVSISVSGLSLLFPFDLPLFGKTFGALNATGLPQALGLGDLPVTLNAHQEMQLSQAWHSIVAFLFVAVIIAHIYIGSVGMEGAFDAVGTGEVDVQWAKEHHSLWYEEVTGKAPGHPGAEPAE